MQEGSLRVDANVNLHIDTPAGKVATPIVEVKNMNSFRAVERALAYEAERQYEAWQETGQTIGQVPKTTRGWDEASQTTRPQRSKEESSDYRYFPDPDLVPVDDRRGGGRARSAPRWASCRRPSATRLERTYGITPYDSDVLVNQGRELVDYYVELAAAVRRRQGGQQLGAAGRAADAQRAEDRRRRVPRARRGAGRGDRHGPLRAAGDQPRPRGALADMIAFGRSLRESMQAMGIQAVDDSELVDLCRQLLADNPKIVAEAKEGKLKGVGQLIGQAKKKNPNVSPNRVRELCLNLIAKM